MGGGPRFAEAGMISDGARVREDARVAVPDADRFNEAGLCRTGGTRGVLCAPSGSPIGGATVTAHSRDCDGNPVVRETTSIANGRFQLDGLAPGPTDVTIQAGNFIKTFQIEIIGGVVVSVADGQSDKVCLEADSADLAVLSGNFDSIEEILGDLGFEHDVFCGEAGHNRPGRALLLDRERLFAYDVLFINCGSGINLRAENPELETIVQNLRDFVAQGGSVYASDLAADFVDRAWPDQVGFFMRTTEVGELDACCACGDCGDSCIEEGGNPRACGQPNTSPQACRNTNAGVSGRGSIGDVEGEVDSQLLRDFLEADAITIRFDAGGWVEMGTGVRAAVEVLVSRPGEEGAPLMVMFQPEPGGGRVAYTSFHNHSQANESMKRILQAFVFQL